MSELDLEGARRYALERLELELSPKLVYHTLQHTRDDVVPAAARLAAMVGVTGEDLSLLLTAGYYHDIGFVQQPDGHEAISIRIASRALPRFGYTYQHIRAVAHMIGVTRLPQSPHTLIEQIIADADLDLFGRDDFIARNAALRAERAALGSVVSDEDWYGSQLKFVRSHRYFTEAARTLRDAKKQQNIEELEKLYRRSTHE